MSQTPSEYFHSEPRERRVHMELYHVRMDLSSFGSAYGIEATSLQFEVSRFLGSTESMASCNFLPRCLSPSQSPNILVNRCIGILTDSDQTLHSPTVLSLLNAVSLYRELPFVAKRLLEAWIRVI